MKIWFLLTSGYFFFYFVSVIHGCTLFMVTGATDRTYKSNWPWCCVAELRAHFKFTLTDAMSYWAMRWLHPTASSWLSWRHVTPVTSELVTGSSLCRFRPFSKFHTCLTRRASHHRMPHMMNDLISCIYVFYNVSLNWQNVVSNLKGAITSPSNQSPVSGV